MNKRKKNILFMILYIWVVVLVIYMYSFGDISDDATIINVMGFIGLLCAAITFFWMLLHCISNVFLNFKPLWIILFIFGTYLTAGVYYIFVYRKFDSGRGSFADNLVKKHSAREIREK